MSDLDPRLSEQVTRVYRRELPASDDARARLKQRLQAERPPRSANWLEQVIEPRIFTVSPLSGAFIVIALIALGGALALRLAPASVRESPGPAAVAPIAATEPTRVVQFVLVAPNADHVALVGDFNGWDEHAAPMQRTGDAWTLAVPVTSGRHVYAFVVDGSRWLSDPAAPLAPEDEFGFRKSVLVVGGSEST
jgi:hypothetical protein